MFYLLTPPTLQQRIPLGMTGIISFMTVLLALLIQRMWLGHCQQQMVAPAVLTTTAGAVSVAADDEAKVVVENGVVKFYFASGKADLATGANEALAEVVKGVKAGQKAVVSGFHDNTGNLAANQELAKQRAISVRDTLVALGVPADSIELKKPENAEGTGDNAQARRVEVVLAK